MYSNGGLFVRRRPPPPKHQQKLVWTGITIFTTIGLLLYVRHVVTRLLSAHDNANLRRGMDSADGELDEYTLSRGDPHFSDVYDEKGFEGLRPMDRQRTDEELAAYEQELLEQAKEAGIDGFEPDNSASDGKLESGQTKASDETGDKADESPPVQDEFKAGAAAPPKQPEAVAPSKLTAPDAVKQNKAVAPAGAAEPSPPALRYKALIFTMDGITDYVKNSKAGGPAGEIIVRESLEWGLRQLGVEPVVATSDAEFARLSSSPEQYQLFFLDPWTFVDPGQCSAVSVVGSRPAEWLCSQGYDCCLNVRKATAVAVAA